MQSAYVEHNDAVLLVIIPASLAPEISSYKALRIAKEYDGESGFTIDYVSCYACEKKSNTFSEKHFFSIFLWSFYC